MKRLLVCAVLVASSVAQATDNVNPATVTCQQNSITTVHKRKTGPIGPPELRPRLGTSAHGGPAGQGAI